MLPAKSPTPSRRSDTSHDPEGHLSKFAQLKDVVNGEKNFYLFEKDNADDDDDDDDDDIANPRIIAGGNYYFFHLKKGRFFEGRDYSRAAIISKNCWLEVVPLKFLLIQ